VTVEHRPIRPWVPWRDPMILVMFGTLIVFIGLVVWRVRSEPPSSAARAPWGALVPTDCRALRQQARQFTQGAVNAGRDLLSGSPTSRALVAIAELQLWQAEGCRP
jgi:hypothetical protein